MNKVKLLGMSFKHIIIGLLFIGIFLTGCFPQSQNNDPAIQESPPVPSEISPVEPTENKPTPQEEVAEDSSGDWMEYYSDTFHFKFSYPASWYGPDVYEAEGSLRLEVGSDLVYPYGTDRTEQVTTIPDSYYITIQYFENIQGRTWDDFIASGWITAYLELLDLPDGEAVTTPRSLTIRVREVTLGDFQGLEYIATLSETAQTERVYLREIMAFDGDLNWLRVTGSPHMVQITDPENWKNDYRRVDEDNLEIFSRLAESIVIQ
jgi:hypothetical protein